MTVAEDPAEKLEAWFRAVKSDLCKRHGVHLIPGPLQSTLGLPVRQVYIEDDTVFRIEADGRVTTRLR